MVQLKFEIKIDSIAHYFHPIGFYENYLQFKRQ